MLVVGSSGEAMLAVRGQLGNQLSQFGDERHVIQNGRLAPVDPLSRTLRLDREIRARHTQDFTDRLQRSSPGSNGERAINFFARPYSTASRRISTSIVFLPNSR